MLIPLSWLKEYVNVTVPTEELAHRLTMAGIEVGAINTPGNDWDHIVVGLVELVEPHPNADRLSLCTVDFGGLRSVVVCGAPNVGSGQKVAYAQVGANLINPETGTSEVLKAARIRGVTSEGMICSEKELGLGDNHTGILVLPPEASIGMSLANYLGKAILDLEVTPNRPDCLSIIGVAREVAVLTDQELKEPSAQYPQLGRPIDSMTSVDLMESDLCPRYACSLITGVKVTSSPDWIQERLLQAGMRPINNVVDVTNYVLLEYGQPLHAFNFDALEEHRIVVRKALPSEKLLTLDGEERQLEPSMLIIADGKRPVALGGVMGGVPTEVNVGTTSVLIESASFSPTSIRGTSRDTGLRTEASLRFEKGMRPHLVPVALRRATQLVLEVAGGTVADGILDVFPENEPPSQLTLTMAHLKKVMGVDFSHEQVQRVLTSLGFDPLVEDEVFQVTVPYWRSDINLEEDLVEEVARIIGYDSIPTTMLSAPIPYHQPSGQLDFRERVKDLLVQTGLQETISYPLISQQTLDWVSGPDGIGALIRVANPMNSEQEYLRTTLRASVLSTASYNLRHQERTVPIFEIARIFLPQGNNLPEERESLVGVLAGLRSEGTWLAESSMFDFYDGKGILEALFSGVGAEVKFELSKDPIFQSGRAAQITSGESIIGVLGEIRPAVLEKFEVDISPVVLFELDLEILLRTFPEGIVQFQPFPRVPGVLRDMALVVDTQVPATSVQALIENHPLVIRASLFDVYTGEGITDIQRSLAYRVLFQSPHRTLTADEVSEAQNDILNLLEKNLGARLRQQ
jgi:phenylalanyl-tRNA synthetase beta chain